MLLLAAEPVSGGLWRYTYSPEPGVTVSVVTVPGPGMPLPADSIMADVINAISPERT